MSRQNQLDKVLASLEADRAVLDLAIAKIKAQQQQRDAKPARVRKPKNVTGAERT